MKHRAHNGATESDQAKDYRTRVLPPYHVRYSAIATTTAPQNDQRRRLPSVVLGSRRDLTHRHEEHHQHNNQGRHSGQNPEDE
jgi:hypothetical protein